MKPHREKEVRPHRRSPAYHPQVSRGPSFYLLLLATFLIALFSTAYVTEMMSFSVHLYTSTPLYFFCAMCVHDAVHKAAHKSRILNVATGWIGSLLLGMTYPIIRRSHLKHHTSAGHEDDHEAFIYSHNWTIPIRILVTNWRCYGVYGDLQPIEKWQAA
ncbi:MAG TPA: hypothetical protein DDW52_02950, partial [Planctomycetaceae bacterium]|nr:hypothetical protein [Planctomycetaceae bacterium]